MSSGIVVLNVRACYHGIGEDKCAIVWSDSSIFVGAHILWVNSSSAAGEFGLYVHLFLRKHMAINW